MRIKKIAFIQPVLPEYRVSFFQSLSKALSDKYTLDYYAAPYESYTKIESSNKILYKKISFVRLGPFYYIRGIFGIIRASDYVVLPSNIRDVGFLIYWLWRKKIYLFGHSSSGCIAPLRDFLFGKYKVWFTYYPSKKMVSNQVSFYNATYSLEDVRAPVGCEIEKIDVFYIGRVTRDKKIEHLITSIIDFNCDSPIKIRLNIIGEIEENFYIPQNPNINYCGSTYRFSDIHKMCKCATALIHPSAVGLLFVLANLLALPIIFLKNERHGPEKFALHAELSFEVESFEDMFKTILSKRVKKVNRMKVFSESMHLSTFERSISILVKEFDE